jgi:hypothetical protein
MATVPDLQPTADRLIPAAITGTARRHCPLSGWLPQGEEIATAEVAEAARGRADLLAQFAGRPLGLAAGDVIPEIACQRMHEASLAALAGADMSQVARWIPEGLATAEHARAAKQRLEVALRGADG